MIYLILSHDEWRVLIAGIIICVLSIPYMLLIVYVILRLIEGRRIKK